MLMMRNHYNAQVIFVFPMTMTGWRCLVEYMMMMAIRIRMVLETGFRLFRSYLSKVKRLLQYGHQAQCTSNDCW